MASVGKSGKRGHKTLESKGFAASGCLLCFVLLCSRGSEAQRGGSA